MAKKVLTGFNQSTLSLVETYVQSVRHDLRLPGLSLAIVQNGRMVYAAGFGSAGPGRAVDPQTPFILGSLSKSFTAFAVMQLVDYGKLRLDDSVQVSIPWFTVGSPAGPDITIRHLMTHTSGLSCYVGRKLLSGRGDKSIEQSVRDLSSVKLMHTPGSQFEYSNTNYLILALLIEIVSGEPYPLYIQKHIFEPLLMRDSYVAQEAAGAHLAQGYRWWFGLPVPFDAPFLPDAQGAAFLISSAGDMARWLLLHLSDGSLDRVRLLSPAGLKELHRPQINTKKKGSRAAMGWRVEKLGDENILRHGGEVSNFRADMILVPGQNLGVVMLQNCNNGLVAQLGLDQLASGLVRLLLGLQPVKSRLSFKRFYGVLDTVIVLLSVLQWWSFASLLRERSRSPQHEPEKGNLGRYALPLMWEILLPLVLIKRLPKIANTPWSLLRLYVPDLTTCLSGMMVISLTMGIIRLRRIIALMRRKRT